MMVTHVKSAELPACEKCKKEDLKKWENCTFRSEDVDLQSSHLPCGETYTAQGKREWNEDLLLRRRVIIDDYPTGMRLKEFKKEDLFLSPEFPSWISCVPKFLSVMMLSGIFLGDIILKERVERECWCGNKELRRFSFHKESGETKPWNNFAIGKWVCPECGVVGEI